MIPVSYDFLVYIMSSLGSFRPDMSLQSEASLLLKPKSFNDHLYDSPQNNLTHGTLFHQQW